MSTETKATAIIAGILLAGTLAFAWVRSRDAAQGAVTTDSSAAAAANTDGAATLGGATYLRECGPCHGSRTGDSAEVGRLADDLYRSDEGIALVEFLLHGGAAEEHPPFDYLSDEQIVTLLAFLLAYGDVDGGAASGGRPAMSADEVAALRAER